MFLDRGPARPSSIVLPAVIFFASAGLLLGWYVPAFTAQHGLPVIDVGLHSPQQTLTWMADYSPAARHDYLVFLLLDCLFPVAGALFTVAIARVALTSFDRERSSLRFVLLIPAVAALCDLLENACHAALTLFYPQYSESLAMLAWVFTSMKLVFFLGAQALLLLSICALLSKLAGRLRSSGS